MELMTNKYLVLPTIHFNGGVVRNLTEINTLPDIPEKYSTNEYSKLYLMENDRLIESLSFELYENTNYWDILLKLNGVTNVSHLPVNNDIILLRATSSLTRWMKAGAVMKGINLIEQYDDVITILESGAKVEVTEEGEQDQQVVKRKYLSILDEETEKNERYRNFKYLSLGDMSELEADLDVLKQRPKIPEGLIINISETE